MALPKQVLSIMIKKTGFTDRKLEIEAVGGVGMAYQLTNRINFRLEPVYRKSLNGLNTDPIKYYPYSIGSNVSVLWSI